jgi:predicted metal-dependent peptidase
LSAAIPTRLQGALLRIRADHPFLGTLALFADIRVTSEVAVAATDGRVLWFNPAYVVRLEWTALCGLVTHELLHAALLHAVRRGVREPLLWNIAADVVVNAMIRQDTVYALPAGAVELPDLGHLSVEEVYEQIQSGRESVPELRLVDLLCAETPDLNGVAAGAPRPSAPGAEGDTLRIDEVERLRRHWHSALQQSAAVAQRVGKGIGRHGLDAVRDARSAVQPSLSWRELLWQFIVTTPCDFGGFDRRFVHRKLYLEEVVGETVNVAICIDTSGSIGGQFLDAFMGEVQGVLDAYPQIRGELFFSDAALYGPHEFSRQAPRPEPRGGGGTDFQPFFRWLEGHSRTGTEPVAIYLTDGYGMFPAAPPSGPTLWVVSSGGLQTRDFPFGEVARMGA